MSSDTLTNLQQKTKDKISCILSILQKGLAHDIRLINDSTKKPLLKKLKFVIDTIDHYLDQLLLNNQNEYAICQIISHVLQIAYQRGLINSSTVEDYIKNTEIIETDHIEMMVAHPLIFNKKEYESERDKRIFQTKNTYNYIAGKIDQIPMQSFSVTDDRKKYNSSITRTTWAMLLGGFVIAIGGGIGIWQFPKQDLAGMLFGTAICAGCFLFGWGICKLYSNWYPELSKIIDDFKTTCNDGNENNVV